MRKSAENWKRRVEARLGLRKSEMKKQATLWENAEVYSCRIADTARTYINVE